MIKKIPSLLTWFSLLSVIAIPGHTQTFITNHRDTIIVQSGIEKDRVSPIWVKALTNRMPADKIDSIAGLTKPLTIQEENWEKIIQSKSSGWNLFRDSLGIPFKAVNLSDTIYILTGYSGRDDGFTYGLQTVCFDLTALQREYGNVDLPENDKRIDGCLLTSIRICFTRHGLKKQVMN